MQELQELHQTHGDCRVPEKYPLNPSLGIWVKTMRADFKKRENVKQSSMTAERITELSNLGFDWSLIEDLRCQEALRTCREDKMISLQGKTNFLEKRVWGYSKSGDGVENNHCFDRDADFWGARGEGGESCFCCILPGSVALAEMQLSLSLSLSLLTNHNDVSELFCNFNGSQPFVLDNTRKDNYNIFVLK